MVAMLTEQLSNYEKQFGKIPDPPKDNKSDH